MVFSLNFCIIKRVIYSKYKGEQQLKKILIMSLLSIAVLIGVQEKKEAPSKELATTENAYTTYGGEDPGGGGI
jgi:hypothetical protein